MATPPPATPTKPTLTERSNITPFRDVPIPSSSTDKHTDRFSDEYIFYECIVTPRPSPSPDENTFADDPHVRTRRSTATSKIDRRRWAVLRESARAALNREPDFSWKPDYEPSFVSVAFPFTSPPLAATPPPSLSRPRSSCPPPVASSSKSVIVPNKKKKSKTSRASAPVPVPSPTRVPVITDIPQSLTILQRTRYVRSGRPLPAVPHDLVPWKLQTARHNYETGVRKVRRAEKVRKEMEQRKASKHGLRNETTLEELQAAEDLEEVWNEKYARWKAIFEPRKTINVFATSKKEQEGIAPVGGANQEPGGVTKFVLTADGEMVTVEDDRRFFQIEGDSASNVGDMVG